MSVTDGQSWCPFQLISCDTEVKKRQAAHASTETKVNPTQFNQKPYGVIYDVLRLDTWQETQQVCVCMPLSLCSWRADGGSGHTCHEREAIETPALESTLIGGKWSQCPSRNNAQWSVRGRGGGGVCRQGWREGGGEILYLSLFPPSLLHSLFHSVPLFIQIRVEQCHKKPGRNGELTLPSAGRKELGMAAKRSSP